MHAGYGDLGSAGFARCSTLGDAPPSTQQELHSGYAAQGMVAWGGGLGGPLTSWPGYPPTGTSGAMAGTADLSLYSQLAAAQRQGRPPLPGGGTNRLSAPADLQQELRAFAAGQPISSRLALAPHGRWSLGAPSTESSSSFVPFNTELPFDEAAAERHGQGHPHQFTPPFQGYPHNAGNRPNYDGAAGASNIATRPVAAATSISEYAASLIGFGSRGPAPDGYPASASAGLHSLETGLGLGGSGLATNSVPLLSGTLRSGSGRPGLGPYQEGVEHSSTAWPSLTTGAASYGSHPQQQASVPYLGRTTSTPDAPGLHQSLLPPPSSQIASCAHTMPPSLPALDLAAWNHQQQQSYHHHHHHHQLQRASLGSASDGTQQTAWLPAGRQQQQQQQQHRRTSSMGSDDDAEDWHPEDLEDDEDEEDRERSCGGGRGQHAASPLQRRSWHAEVRAAAAAADAAAAAGGKPKVGRPRKYDLSADAGSSGAEGSGGTGRRGARAKYANKQEALARRRERNRASALEAYYKGKARRTQLEAQLLALKEEDAALHALSAVAHADAGAAVHIRQLLSAGVAAVEVTRRLRSGQ